MLHGSGTSDEYQQVRYRTPQRLANSAPERSLVVCAFRTGPRSRTSTLGGACSRQMNSHTVRCLSRPLAPRLNAATDPDLQGAGRAPLRGHQRPAVVPFLDRLRLVRTCEARELRGPRAIKRLQLPLASIAFRCFPRHRGRSSRTIRQRFTPLPPHLSLSPSASTPDHGGLAGCSRGRTAGTTTTPGTGREPLPRRQGLFPESALPRRAGLGRLPTVCPGRALCIVRLQYLSRLVFVS